MRDGPPAARPRPDVAPEIEAIENRILHQLSGRLRDLRLERRGEGVVLTGRARSYYARQLAQQAVMRATALPVLGNEIEVS